MAWTKEEIDEQEARAARVGGVVIRNPTTLDPDFILTSTTKRGGAVDLNSDIMPGLKRNPFPPGTSREERDAIVKEWSAADPLTQNERNNLTDAQVRDLDSGRKSPRQMAAELRKKGKRRVQSTPTAASISRQEARLSKAREATAEADRLDKAAREKERLIKEKEKEVDDMRKEVKAKLKTIQALRPLVKKDDAKAKVARVKAAKLAKG